MFDGVDVGNCDDGFTRLYFNSEKENRSGLTDDQNTVSLCCRECAESDVSAILAPDRACRCRRSATNLFAYDPGLGTEAAATIGQADGQFPWERAGLTHEERMDLCATHYKSNILHKLDGTSSPWQC